MVNLFRIDDRLIHAQVVVGWGRKLRPDRIILADDRIAAEDWERELYASAAEPDIKATILTLAEAVMGTKREISVRAPVTCQRCEGSGAAQGASRETCSTCQGSGQVSNARGFVMFTTTCPACRGQGSVISSPCEDCHGAGQVEKTRKVLVTFPAGIDAGQRLRVPRQGAAGPQGGPPGDLYVDVDVQPHDRFERDGSDLFTRVHITFADAALGTSVTIEMLDESEVEVEVGPGTQPGDVLSLRGKGVPRVDGRGRGTLHAVVQVDVPKRVSSRAKELLRELEKELAQPSSGKRASVG